MHFIGNSHAAVKFSYSFWGCVDTAARNETIFENRLGLSPRGGGKIKTRRLDAEHYLALNILENDVI